jgi:hypothetical protein
MATAEWKQVGADFGRGTGTMMGNAVDATKTFSNYFNNLGQQIVAEERQKVLDDRATTLFGQSQDDRTKLLKEQADEKAKQEAARNILAVYGDTQAAADNKGYNQALDKWTAGGMQGAAPVIQDYNASVIPANVNLTTKVPNVGGTSGRTIFSNVAKQVVTPGTEVIPQTAVQQVAPTKGLSLDTNGFTPWIGGATGSNSKSVQYIDTPYGADTKTTKPSMSLNYTPSEAKADKLLAPTTPKQAATTKNKVTTVMQKVATGMTSGTPPKLNQMEGALIEKIFSTVDPEAQNRKEGRKSLESMLFSLGMKPSDVKEYADMGVKSVYGDGADPLKLALANAKMDAAKENIKSTNDLGALLYKEQKQDARTAMQENRADARSKSSTASSKIPKNYMIDPRYAPKGYLTEAEYEQQLKQKYRTPEELKDASLKSKLLEAQVAELNKKNNSWW